VATFQNRSVSFHPIASTSPAAIPRPDRIPRPRSIRHHRLYVAYTDIVGGKAQVFLTYADVATLRMVKLRRSWRPRAVNRTNVN